METGYFFINMHLDHGDGNTRKESRRHGGYTCCGSVNGKNGNKNFFYIPEYGIKIPLDCNMAWMFFGSEVVHGTTKPEDLDESTFYKYDVKAGRSIGVDNNVSVAWGVYNRAPPEEIYRRNINRFRRFVGWIFMKIIIG